MNREKAAQNRNKASQLNEAWGVGAAQRRYRETGDWYAALTRFPAALFDAHGYVLFETEEEYRTSPHLKIGKQIYVPHGISKIPGYLRGDSDTPTALDVDIQTDAATKGRISWPKFVTTNELAGLTAGGDDYIRTKRNEVKGLALRLDLNPDAPDAVVFGKGPQIEARAQRLVESGLTGPTYV